MSFVSVNFVYFFLVVLALYYVWPRLREQNLLILISSYLFYGAWDWRFLALIFLVSIVNFAAAQLNGSARWRKPAMISAVVFSLGMLAVFKYFGFFMESAAVFFGALGIDVTTPTLQILLPVGISFFTFQALAYTIDVYRGNADVERNVTCFLAYIAFFPQLVAGPIERAQNLLAQFRQPRVVTREMVRQGIWLIIYGYFMKVVIADGLAPIVDSVYSEDQHLGWSTILGTIAFGLQIYGDFLGYSLIAKGLAALLGFNLIFNFRLPYWATSVPEFWHRWHISLSTWLRDYLYISLGGNRRGELITYRNLMITMTLGGLWHGANWTFIVWGVLHGVALVIWRYFAVENAPKVLGWLLTMLVVFASWFFFRATDAAEMNGMIAALSNLEWVPAHWQMLQAIVAAIAVVCVLEYPQAKSDNPYVWIDRWPVVSKVLIGLMIVTVFAMVSASRSTFIYFQF